MNRHTLLFASIMLTVMLYTGCAPAQVEVKGTVETTILSHYTENAGKIIASPVESGQAVKAGDILAVLDTTQENFALEQLESVLLRKQATLDLLLAGADAAELQQASNQVALAQEALRTAGLTYERAEKDLADARLLFAAGALEENRLQTLIYQAELAQSAVYAANTQTDSARQQLRLLGNGAAREEITMATADLAQTESQIRQSKERIARSTITALADGIVINKNYLLGDFVSPGNNLLDIADSEHKYAAAYWPADRLFLLDYGQEMMVTTPAAVYGGTLMFIDTSAAYTPKEEQSAANKNKTSLLIKVRLEAGTPLEIGESVTVGLGSVQQP